MNKINIEIILFKNIISFYPFNFHICMIMYIRLVHCYICKIYNSTNTCILGLNDFFFPFGYNRKNLETLKVKVMNLEVVIWDLDKS